MRMKPETRRSLVDVVRERADVQSEKRAYTFLDAGEEEGSRLTWAELDRRSRAIAAALAGRAPSQSRVLLLFPPGLDFIPAFFGVLYAGMMAVPTYPPAGGRVDRAVARLRGMIADADIALVLAPAAVRDHAAALEELVPELRGIEWLAIEDVPDALAGGWVDPRCGDGIALLQYTSGSTAAPRGVMVSHGNLLHNLAHSAALAGHDASSVSVSWLPVNHDMGLIDGVLQPAYSGFPAYLMSPAAFLQRPVRWLQAISRLRATHSGGPNFAYDLCVRRVPDEARQSLDLSSWKIAFNGSEPVRPATLKAFQRAFGECGFRWDACRPAYGLAESTLLVTSSAPGDGPALIEVDPDAMTRGVVARVAAGSHGSIALVSSGAIDDESRVIVVDPVSCRQVLPHRVGEIWVAGQSVALGYWRRPDDSLATFGARLADTGEGPFLRTGDLGAVCDGQLFVTGRIKDILIVRGMKHYPHDLEQTAERAHPALRIGCCAAFATAQQGDEGVTIVAEMDPRTIGGGLATVPLGGVLSAIRRAIAETHHVALASVALVPAGSLPKTTSGKLQRYLCRDAFTAGALEILDQWTGEPSRLEGLAS